MPTAKPSLKVGISYYTNTPLQVLPLLTFKGDLLTIAGMTNKTFSTEAREYALTSIP